MELRVLRYVIAVADERHFGRAATRVHVAQSALSQQVKQLEAKLGVRLFDRTTRRVEVTEAGVRFVGHAREVVAAADRATAAMAAVAAGRLGAVSVGFVGTATYDVLPRVSQAVRSALPDVDLTLRGEMLNPALVDAVAAGTLDLALVRPHADLPAGLDVEHLRTERLVAVLPTSHPLAHPLDASEVAGRPRLDLALLAGETFVVHPSGDRSSMHHQVLAACRRAGFEPRELVEVAETATLAVLVAAGVGVALVPEPVRSLALAGITYVDLLDPPDVELALLSRTASGSPAVHRVADEVRRAVRAGHRL